MMGEMNDPDLELLSQYARQNSEDAFAELVRRHLNLVYSAALRQVRLPQLAEEVAQAAFTKLARHALTFPPDTILSAWLYRVTRNEAIDCLRREARRQLREHAAFEMHAMNASDDWARIEPLLDEAMLALDESDRTAVLLRYFEGKSFREVGQAIGASDDTAQKRVSRAIDRLRAYFAGRGVPVATSGLAALIQASAVQGAPAGLGAAIASGALLGSGAAAAAGAALPILVMTTTQKLAVATALVLAAGAGWYHTHQISRLNEENSRLQAQVAPLAEQMSELERSLRDAAGRITALSNENARLTRNSADLLKLRAAHTQLQQEAGAASDPFVQQALDWKQKATTLRQLFAERPDQRIPELALLSDDQWLNVAKEASFDTDQGVRKALSQARFTAKNAFAPALSAALAAYVNANYGMLPTDLNQLQPHFKQPIERALLEQYQLQFTGKFEDIPSGAWAVASRELIDDEHDSHWNIGPNGYGNQSSKAKRLEDDLEELAPALDAYAAARNGHAPANIEELRPYVTTPVQEAILKRLEREQATGTPTSAQP